VNHYSFHILDREWGHVTIKLSGHPPFPAQIILNGHEYVEREAAKAGIGCRKEGNCFSRISDAEAFAAVAETLTAESVIGRLTAVCDRWIYKTACVSHWIARSGNEADSATSIRRISWSTAETSCLRRALRCNR